MIKDEARLSTTEAKVFNIEDLIIEIVHEYEKLNKTNIEFIFINDNSTKDKFNIRGSNIFFTTSCSKYY
jgi:hypothetical protein